VSIWINRAFASALSDGSMAALNNANQLMQVPLGIFAATVYARQRQVFASAHEQLADRR
jgi:peptidoglycan biosynthesis protein MviN/MurJ (putative lipid II flippase)